MSIRRKDSFLQAFVSSISAFRHIGRPDLCRISSRWEVTHDQNTSDKLLRIQEYLSSLFYIWMIHCVIQRRSCSKATSVRQNNHLITDRAVHWLRSTGRKRDSRECCTHKLFRMQNWLEARRKWFVSLSDENEASAFLFLQFFSYPGVSLPTVRVKLSVREMLLKK